MKKGPSNRSEPLRATLPKQRILRGESSFASLFRASTTLRRPAVHLKYRILSDYQVHEADLHQADLRIAFLTPRRIGGAVARNTMRRRMREIYRRHQGDFFPALERLVMERCEAAGSRRPTRRSMPSVHAVFICQKADIPSRDLAIDMRDLMASFVTKAGERIVG